MDYDDAYVNVASDYADEIEEILIDLCNESTRINTIKRTVMNTPYGFTGTSSTLKFSDIIDTNEYGENNYGELRQIVDVLDGFLLDLRDALRRSRLERYPFFERYARIIYRDCNWPSYQFAASLLTHIKNKLKPERDMTAIVEQLKRERQDRDRRHRGGKKTNKNNRKKNKSMKKSKK